MKSFDDISSITEALADLGALLAERGESLEVCVVGGAAFLMQEPDRYHSTADIDVAARVGIDGDLTTIDTMPGSVVEAVRAVASLHGLSEGWMNPAVAQSFGMILPLGFLDRATRHEYGALVVHVASRTDLIRLKLLAAMRRGSTGRRHLQDLLRAQPSTAEVEGAAAWVRAEHARRDSTEERLDELVARILEALDA